MFPTGTEADDLRSLRLHGKLARNLGVLIVSGAYRTGQLLETEAGASERHQVSRAAYREAVRMLSAKGLVESRPKVGTRVTHRDKWHLLDADVFTLMFQSEPEEGLLDALFELRMIVEPEASALAAQRRTSDHLDRMKRALGEMRDNSLATAEGRAGDQDFHAALLVASDSPFLRSLTSSVSTAVSWTTVLKQKICPLVRDTVPDHERVYDAIAARDAAEARAAMAKLLELARLGTHTAPKSKAQAPENAA